MVLVPLGGGSLINGISTPMLAEIARITTRVSVLIDSERASENDPVDASRKQFVENCSSLGFNVHVLQRRALENYFPDDVVKRVKGEKYRGLGAFENRSAVQPVWGKNENWQLAAAMKQKDLAGTDLESFFSGLASELAETAD